ncbi:hypothetical protein JCM6882_003361 [Rhodosporidiobolus microsporus]
MRLSCLFYPLTTSLLVPHITAALPTLAPRELTPVLNISSPLSPRTIYLSTANFSCPTTLPLTVSGLGPNLSIDAIRYPYSEAEAQSRDAAWFHVGDVAGGGTGDLLWNLNGTSLLAGQQFALRVSDGAGNWGFSDVWNVEDGGKGHCDDLRPPAHKNAWQRMGTGGHVGIIILAVLVGAPVSVFVLTFLLAFFAACCCPQVLPDQKKAQNAAAAGAAPVLVQPAAQAQPVLPAVAGEGGAGAEVENGAPPTYQAVVKAE